MLRPQAENALNGRWLATYRTGFPRSITPASRTPWCLREQTRLQNGSRFVTATGGRSSPHTKHRPSLRTLGSLSPISRRDARRPLIQESLLLAARRFLRPFWLHRCLLVVLRKRFVTLLPSHVQLLSLVGRSRQGSYRLRVGLDRVALHADLTMLAGPSQAPSRARAGPLASLSPFPQNATSLARWAGIVIRQEGGCLMFCMQGPTSIAEDDWIATMSRALCTLSGA
jgi:hypothetical protein